MDQNQVINKKILFSELKNKYGYEIIEEIYHGNFSAIKLKVFKNNGNYIQSYSKYG